MIELCREKAFSATTALLFCRREKNVLLIYLCIYTNTAIGSRVCGCISPGVSPLVWQTAYACTGPWLRIVSCWPCRDSDGSPGTGQLSLVVQFAFPKCHFRMHYRLALLQQSRASVPCGLPHLCALFILAHSAYCVGDRSRGGFRVRTNRTTHRIATPGSHRNYGPI